MKSRIAATLALALTPVGAVAASPQTPKAWTIDAIPWESAAPDGTRYALLEGDRQAAGAPFTYAFFIPAGVWDSPHSHSTTARVFIAKGELRLGYGPHEDHRRAARYAAGGVVVVPGGAVHFDGAEVDTIIIGVATGAWATTYVNKAAAASAGTQDPRR